MENKHPRCSTIVCAYTLEKINKAIETRQSIDIGNTGHKIQTGHKQDWTIHRHWQHWTQDTERYIYMDHKDWTIHRHRQHWAQYTERSQTRLDN